MNNIEVKNKENKTARVSLKNCYVLYADLDKPKIWDNNVGRAKYELTPALNEDHIGALREAVYKVVPNNFKESKKAAILSMLQKELSEYELDRHVGSVSETDFKIFLKSPVKVPVYFGEEKKQLKPDGDCGVIPSAIVNILALVEWRAENVYKKDGKWVRTPYNKIVLRLLAVHIVRDGSPEFHTTEGDISDEDIKGWVDCV